MVTRKEFLKLAGIGAAAASTVLVGLPQTRGAVLEGVGELRRFVAGEPRLVSTLCPGCPAGCAVKLTVAGGQVLDVQGNPGHPLSCSGSCDGLETALRLLDAPQRLRGPLYRPGGRGRALQELSWRAATAALGEVLAAYRPEQIAFVLGDYPDHLNDLVRRLAGALGGATVLRFTALSLLDGGVTLQDAARRLFGLPRLPYFDLPHSNLVFSFGSNGGEPWLARCAAVSARPAGQAWVHFTPLRPPLAGAEDEWVCIRPGSEGLLAHALADSVAQLKVSSGLDQALSQEVQAASQATGIAAGDLLRLAGRFASSSAALSLPGAGCLTGADGLAAAQAVLRLNTAAGSLGRPGGLYHTPEAPLGFDLGGRTATLAELQALLRRMESGQVKALFLHGVDLLAALPPGLEVRRALQTVERVISFNSMLNETSLYADLLLPDHLPLEGWGYQRLSPAADRPLVSAIQPALRPRYNTRATADVLLRAACLSGNPLAAYLPYWNEQELVRKAVISLPWGPDAADPWEGWLGQGGWWTVGPVLLPPVGLRSARGAPRRLAAPPELDPTNAEFYLCYTQQSGFAGLPANPVGLVPAALHPAAIQRLGLRPGERVRLRSAGGEIEAVLVEQAGLQPDTLVLPNRLPDRPGVLRALALVNGEQNASGDLAYQSGRVRVLTAA